MIKTHIKKLLPATLLLASLVAVQANPLQFKLSPPGSSPGLGLSPANEVPAVTNSSGSGDEILTGISFDTNTMRLSFAVGYGATFGFSNLTGTATAAHIHGPASVTNAAGVLFDLAAVHLRAGDPTQGGLIFGSVLYTPAGASNLLAGLNYINIHTTNNPNGEIRGQLILVQDTTPPVITSITASPDVLWPPNHKLVNVAISVVAWDLSGAVTAKIVSVTSNEPENGLGDGDTAPDWLITSDLGLVLVAERAGNGNGRTYTITVEVADEHENTASGQVTVTVPHDNGHGNGNGNGHGNGNGKDKDKDNGNGKGKGKSR